MVAMQETEKMHVGCSWKILHLLSSSHFSAPQEGATRSKKSKARTAVVSCAVKESDPADIKWEISSEVTSKGKRARPISRLI